MSKQKEKQYTEFYSNLTKSQLESNIEMLERKLLVMQEFNALTKNKELLLVQEQLTIAYTVLNSF